MRRKLLCFVVLALVGSLSAAEAGQTTTTNTTKGKSATSTTKKAPAKATTGAKKTVTKTTTKTTVKTRAPKTPPVTQEDLRRLQDAMQQQTQQIQSLQQQLQQRDSQLQSLQTQVQQAQTTAQQAQTTAAAAAPATQVNQLQTAVSDVQTKQTTVNTTLQATDKRLVAVEKPNAIKFRGISITPGGYFEMKGIVSNHNMNRDVQTSFGSMPFSGTVNSRMSEFHMSARHSRVTLLAEGTVHDNLKAQGYLEWDWAAASSTANETQTNSFVPRIRQAFGLVQNGDSWYFEAGQSYSLWTPHRRGLTVRQEMLPAVIDASLHVGLSYARQAQLRFVKGFNKKAWIGVSVENPETTVGGTTPPGITISGLQTSANSQSPISGYVPTAFGGTPSSTDFAPDVIVKLAFEPGWGHFEVGGMGRWFRDRVQIGNFAINRRNAGAGGTASMILPLGKRMDFTANAAYGAVGRYGAGNGPDTAIRPDGSLVPVKASRLELGLETRPTKNLDFYVYAGGEYFQRTRYLLANGTPVGYGIETLNLTGCNPFPPTEITGTCQAVNKSIFEVTPGFLYRFFRGPYGTFAFGASWSYLERKTWPGCMNGACSPVVPGTRPPNGIANIFETTVRYILP